MKVQQVNVGVYRVNQSKNK